jgi:aryl-alcohol dehydrogenase-like predicted oxidoreductase
MTDRRSFLKAVTAATAGIMVPFTGLDCNSLSHRDRIGELLPLRKLGKTGEKVTMLGLGGAHIGRMDDKTAGEVIEAAMEGGIRFFDNAYGYSDGEAEIRYGKYLVPKYRDVTFIMTKSPAKDYKTALEQLELSLKRMQTDYVDLWQIHHVRSVEDVDHRIENGILDAVSEAKESGKARYIGFTGHADFKSHRRMLERTDLLETCQMPINCFDPGYKSFIKNVLPTLMERKMGILAMKTLSNGGFFGGTRHMEGGDDPKIVPAVASVREALGYVWSLPVSVLITGPNDLDMLNEKIELARSFAKMDETGRFELLQRVADAGFDGKKVEFYKD